MLAPLFALAASAQEPVDIGVVRQSDVRVVQRVLYPKDGRTELGERLDRAVGELHGDDEIGPQGGHLLEIHLHPADMLFQGMFFILASPHSWSC